MITKKEIMSNDFIMEGITNMLRDQEPKDRRNYMNIVTEAMGAPLSKGSIAAKLYSDMISRSNVEFGDIPDSKGNFTQYKNFESITSSVGMINELMNMQNRIPMEVNLMNKLYDILISNRNEFEYGFKMDIDLIKMYYNIGVMSLFELVNLSILAYGEYLKNTKEIEFNFKSVKRNDMKIVHYINSYIKAYEKGEFAKLVNAFKKNTQLSSNNLFIELRNLAEDLVGDKFNNIAIVGTVVTIIIIALFAIRPLLYFFYNRVAAIKDYLKIQAELLKFNAENKEENEIAAVKQKKFAEKISSISSSIEASILRAEKKADIDLAKSNKTNFSPTELSSVENAATEILI